MVESYINFLYNSTSVLSFFFGEWLHEIKQEKINLYKQQWQKYVFVYLHLG